MMREKFGIDSFALKIIAMISMLADHLGAVVLPEWYILRIIGRIAFPIMTYILVEGFFYTHDIKKYLMRIGILALVSEIPFDLAMSGRIIAFNRQNVFFDLFLGLFMLYTLVKITNHVEKFFVALFFILVADFLCADYGGLGLLMILCFYLFRDRRGLKAAGAAFINIFLMGYTQIFAILALIPIGLHNGKQGKRMKWLFYSFYPAHLLVLVLIKIIIM